MHILELTLLFVASTLVPALALGVNDLEETAAMIISKEKAALDRWSRGDPDGFLEISAANVVYFDPFQPERINGIEQLRKVYDDIRGKIQIDHYDINDPKVQVDGNIAILTFNFLSHGSEGVMRWNTTEIYQRRQDGWRIVHTHWSLTQPNISRAPQ